MRTSHPAVLGARLVLVGLPLATAMIYPDCINGPLAKTLVCDQKAAAPDRAAALVKAMDISEKLVNLVECVLLQTSMTTALGLLTMITIARAKEPHA